MHEANTIFCVDFEEREPWMITPFQFTKDNSIFNQCEIMLSIFPSMAATEMTDVSHYTVAL